jgi:sodium/proline symporter
MTKTQSILLTLVAYKLLLIAIGLWASRRTNSNADFFLGGRGLGPTIAAISASASSSSAWTLLSVSGMAYYWGLPALWLFPAILGGYLINWLFVGPRLMRGAQRTGAITLTEFLASAVEPAARPRVLRLAAGIVLFSFMFYIAAQFQAAGDAFASTFGLDIVDAILIGATVIVVYTLLGGFWAVSVTDTVQGLVMALTAAVLPLIALVTIGGPAQLAAGLAALPDDGAGPPGTGLAAFGFIVGTLGIGLGYPGQPHVVNRYMALRDDRALSQGRIIAITWAIVIYAGMLLLGLCGRVLFYGLVESEQILFEVANRLVAPVMAGIMIAAVLSAIMSTADSQLLVAASSIAHDLRRPGAGQAAALGRSRLIVLALSVLAVLLAVGVPAAIFTRVLFAWHAIGSAFGPPLVLILLGVRLTGSGLFRAMLAGFSLTALFHWLPGIPEPGDAVERLVPLLASGAIAWQGRERGGRT